MKTGAAITEETRARILDAAWELIAGRGRADVGLAEVAKAAGVSRQTLYLAFGGRSGLLTAMVRRKDARSPALARLLKVAESRDPAPKMLFSVLSAWFDYLPEVYPVAALLDAAALTDAEAKAAIEDRMVGLLLGGLAARLRGMARAGTLPPDRDPLRTAEAIWALVHLPSWRLLVVDRGWTPEAFRASRLALAAALIGADPPLDADRTAD